MHLMAGKGERDLARAAPLPCPRPGVLLRPGGVGGVARGGYGALLESGRSLKPAMSIEARRGETTPPVRSPTAVCLRDIRARPSGQEVGPSPGYPRRGCVRPDRRGGSRRSRSRRRRGRRRRSGRHGGSTPGSRAGRGRWRCGGCRLRPRPPGMQHAKAWARGVQTGGRRGGGAGRVQTGWRRRPEGRDGFGGFQGRRPRGQDGVGADDQRGAWREGHGEDGG